jgi:ABC-2 type transport system ATP-binding protein
MELPPTPVDLEDFDWTPAQLRAHAQAQHRAWEQAEENAQARAEAAARAHARAEAAERRERARAWIQSQVQALASVEAARVAAATEGFGRLEYRTGNGSAQERPAQGGEVAEAQAGQDAAPRGSGPVAPPVVAPVAAPVGDAPSSELRSRGSRVQQVPGGQPRQAAAPRGSGPVASPVGDAPSSELRAHVQEVAKAQPEQSAAPRGFGRAEYPAEPAASAGFRPDAFRVPIGQMPVRQVGAGEAEGPGEAGGGAGSASRSFGPSPEVAESAAPNRVTVGQDGCAQVPAQVQQPQPYPGEAQPSGWYVSPGPSAEPPVQPLAAPGGQAPMFGEQFAPWPPQAQPPQTQPPQADPPQPAPSAPSNPPDPSALDGREAHNPWQQHFTTNDPTDEPADADQVPAGILEAVGLVKRFGDRTVVDGVSLRLDAGEVLGFLGPNGAGKSTSIAMMTGALRPDSGTVRISGRDLAAEPTVAKSMIGVVPQEIALYPSLSARQNLAFFAGAYQLPRRVRRERIEWALSVVGLTDRANDKVASYSGGMQRRVNIAAALLHRPPLLFLDEPTVGVDAQSRNQIFETVVALRAEYGMSVVYTSHYMPEVEQLCDRIVVVDNGKVLASGTQDELLAPLGEGVLEWQPAKDELATVPNGIESLVQGFATCGQVETATDAAGRALLRVRVANMPEALSRVAWVAAAHNIGLGGIRVGRPDLETLFLDLTGRQLRDGA